MGKDRIRNDGKAGLTYHKVQRAAEIAAGTNGYTGHLNKYELKRRMAVYEAIMDLESKKEVKRI